MVDIKNCLYHGIVDWLNYDKNISRENLCLDKLDSILEKRFIVRPCDFKTFDIKHNDIANPYTYYFTFLACSPESIYADRFKKDIKDDNGYMVATSYSRFGILFDPRLLDDLIISGVSFCNQEIVIEDNISIDKYGLGIYVNPLEISDNCLRIIKELIKKHEYNFDIVSVFDGTTIGSLSEEKDRTRRLLLKL